MATNAVIQTVGAAGYVSLRVTQASHGLTGRVPVYYNTSTSLWTAAQANAGNTLGTHLAKVIDSNTLLIVQSGIFPDTSHGLTAGQYYFVSDSSAGTLTTTEPTAVGSFSNPMIYVTDANTYIVLGYRSSQTVNQSFNPLLNDGTAAAPSLAFSADTDTGFYRIGANTIGIATNGARVGEIGTNYGGFRNNICNFETITGTNDYTGSSGTISDLAYTYTPKFSNSKLVVQVEVMWNSAASASIPGLGIELLYNSVSQRVWYYYTDRGGYIVSNTVNTYTSTLSSTSPIAISVKWQQSSGSPTITIYGSTASYNHYLRIWEIMQ